MKSALRTAAWVGITALLGGTSLLAQMRDNSQKQMTCGDGDRGGDRANYCEIREQSVASIGRLSIDAQHNGGVNVKGWLRNDVLVRAKVQTSADSDGAARSLASRVTVDSSGGQIQALGPQSTDDSGWSVSYEVFVPQNTDLTLKAHNGGIGISDVRGQIRFEGHNGGVHLTRVAGDVGGTTVNGGVQVELAGPAWEGRQMEVGTRNGGVTMTLPASYSAHIQAETRNGRIQSDFPVGPAFDSRARALDLNLGSSGPLIHVTTSNGGVRLTRAQAQ